MTSTYGINSVVQGNVTANLGLQCYVNWSNPGVVFNFNEPSPGYSPAQWYYTPDTTASNISFRNNATGSYFVFGSNGSFFQSSDINLKTNITPIGSTLNSVLQLNPVTYQMIQNDSSTAAGFIAHEVESLFSLCVNESLDPNTNTTTKSVNYIGLIPYLVKSIQEQNALIDELRQEIDALKPG